MRLKLQSNDNRVSYWSPIYSGGKCINISGNKFELTTDSNLSTGRPRLKLVKDNVTYYIRNIFLNKAKNIFTVTNRCVYNWQTCDIWNGEVSIHSGTFTKYIVAMNMKFIVKSSFDHNNTSGCGNNEWSGDINNYGHRSFWDDSGGGYNLGACARTPDVNDTSVDTMKASMFSYEGNISELNSSWKEIRRWQFFNNDGYCVNTFFYLYARIENGIVYTVTRWYGGGMGERLNWRASHSISLAIGVTV